MLAGIVDVIYSLVASAIILFIFPFGIPQISQLFNFSAIPVIRFALLKIELFDLRHLSNIFKAFSQLSHSGPSISRHLLSPEGDSRWGLVTPLHVVSDCFSASYLKRGLQ